MKTITYIAVTAALALLGGPAAVPAPAASAAAEAGIETARTARAVPLTLPAGAYRSTDSASLAQFTAVLTKIAAGAGRRTGTVEALIWEKRGTVRETITADLKKLGYDYAAQPPMDADGDKVTLFAATGQAGADDLLGLWVDHEDQLLLLWTPITDASQGQAPSKAAPGAATDGATTPKPTGSDAGGTPLVLDVEASAETVNVMGKARPALPPMPRLAVRPGVVRGYVRDDQGHPLQGAVIGVRSSAIGGAYSGATAKTDAHGYYEVKAPWGAAEFYCAGYATDYGDGIAAFGLCPADGEADGFATDNGAVKNWVLLPYGITDRAAVQDNPKYSGNYYGGTVILTYDIDEDDGAHALPHGAKVEVTLTPDGPLLDGSQGRPIVVRKTLRDGLMDSLYVCNIPVGRYHLAARLIGGGALRMKETGPCRNNPFGLDPKETTGEATLLLKATDGKPGMAIAAHGHWDEMQVRLERP